MSIKISDLNQNPVNGRFHQPLEELLGDFRRKVSPPLEETSQLRTVVGPQTQQAHVVALVVIMSPYGVAELCEVDQRLQHEDKRGLVFVLLLEEDRHHHLRDLRLLLEEHDCVLVLLARLVLVEGPRGICPIIESFHREVALHMDRKGQAKISGLAAHEAIRLVLLRRGVVEPGMDSEPICSE